MSSLTESQIIAAIGTFGILMVIQLWSGIIGFLPSSAMANVFGIALFTVVVSLGCLAHDPELGDMSDFGDCESRGKWNCIRSKVRSLREPAFNHLWKAEPD